MICASEPVDKKLAQAEMEDAVVVSTHKERGQRDDILRVVILDFLQPTEFSLAGLLRVYKIGNLDVLDFIGPLAYEIYFAGTKVADIHFIAQMQEMLIDDILYHLLDIRLTVASGNEVAQSDVAKVDPECGG